MSQPQELFTAETSQDDNTQAKNSTTSRLVDEDITQEGGRSRATDPVHQRKSQSLPRSSVLVIDNNSSFVKRGAHSSVLIDKMDTFSQMNLPNTSLMGSMSREPDEKIKKPSSCPPAPTQSTRPGMEPVLPDRSTSKPDCSTLPQISVYTSKPRDALSPTTRAYFTHVSQTETWKNERLVRAIYAEIHRKYPRSTVNLRPTRQFMVHLLNTAQPDGMTFEAMFQEVEERWITPILMWHRRLYINSLVFPGLYQ